MLPSTSHCSEALAKYHRVYSRATTAHHHVRLSEIGYLSATITVSDFPEVLDTRGSYQIKAKTSGTMERIAQAEAAILARGEKPTRRALAAEAHADTHTISAYMQTRNAAKAPGAAV